MVRELESKHPNIFGPCGGQSRAFGMNCVALNSGLMLGPLLLGFLAELVGYDLLNVVQGK